MPRTAGKGLSAVGPSFYLPVSITGGYAETSIPTLTDVTLVDRGAYSLELTLEGLTATLSRGAALPTVFSLSGAAPTPFNPYTNITGDGVSSGIYLYRITSGSGYSETKRMTLLK